MSLMAQRIFENQRIYALKQKEMTKEQVLEAAKLWWTSGQSDIKGTMNMIMAKDYKVNILTQQQIHMTDLKKLKKNACIIFSHDTRMKGFVINNADGLKTKQGISWYGNIIDGKLIIANFANVPTGNKVFNKYAYFFNYFELELVPK